MPRGVPNAKAAEPVEPVEVEPAEAPVEPDAPVETPAAEPVEPSGRWESFEATRPNGDVVVVKRNIDTGEQSVTDK